MSKDWYQDMIDFETIVIGDDIPKSPIIPSKETKELRKNLLIEEVDETLNAMNYDDIVEVADGIADSIVILIGTAIKYGIDLRQVWDEVHATNMAKKGGVRREDGKLLKPKGWKPPQIEKILVEQGWKNENIAQ